MVERHALTGIGYNWWILGVGRVWQAFFRNNFSNLHQAKLVLPFQKTESAGVLRLERDHQILHTLACKVRVLSLSQIAAAWWVDGETPELHARRRMADLHHAVLVEQLTVLAGPMLILTAPLIDWRPGDPDPNCSAVAWKLQSRWPQTPPQRITVYTATENCHNQYGGALSPRTVKPGHVTHDLHVSALYLKMCASDPQRAEAWVGEDTRPKSGFKLKDPDVLLDFRDGSPIQAIEFGGKYDVERVRDFHRDCVQRARPYELW